MIWKITRSTMKPFIALMTVVLVIASPANAQSRFSDQTLLDGFNRTVFGLEYASETRGASVVKKFVEPVRIYIDNRAQFDRRWTVERFITGVNQAVRGLDLQLVADPNDANFTVYVVDRAQYAQVIREDIYNSSGAEVRGRCMVRVLTGFSGISQAQAVIVSDEGDFLFQRCLVEEILQGLGPLNDDSTLDASVFNDQSQHTRFMLHDRYVLNMLYHPRIMPGMRRADVDRVLPAVLSDVRSYVR